MSVFETIAHKYLGQVLGPKRVKKCRDSYVDAKIYLQCLCNHEYRESVKKLQKYRNNHKGERCFIIGNGPSLKQMDLSLLKNEFTFGTNRIYLLFKELGFTSTYYVSINKHVLEQCADEISQISCPKFLNWKRRSLFSLTNNKVFLRCRNMLTFGKDIASQGVGEGSTVTFTAMQLAYYMGFSDVILVGVDHNFKTEGPPNKLIESEGDDIDHFDQNYFGKGIKWQLPDLEASEDAYNLAKKEFSHDNRRVVDATVGGKLNVFPKVDYGQIKFK